DPAKRRGTRSASRPPKKTKDRQGGFRFLHRKPKARSSGDRKSTRLISTLSPHDALPILIRQNAEELDRRLVLLKKRKIDKEDFDFFIENQKRDLRVFVDSQPAQAQERAEKLTRSEEHTS